MRCRVNPKPSAQNGGSSFATAAAAAASRLPDVLPEDRSMSLRAPPPRSSGAPVAPASPKPLFSSFNQANAQTRRLIAHFDTDIERTLDLRDKKKLRCIWLAPDEGDQQIVRPPPLDGIHYSYIATSRFGQDVLAKIKRMDALSVNLEKNGRFMDAVHTYEQSCKMLNRCIQKRSESQDVTVEEIKWLRIDYEIRCVQLVALCMLGARKSDAQADNTPFLLLKKAEELTARDGLHYCKKHVQRAAVYQNIANHYKKQKKYQAALQAAEKAIRINEKLPVRDRLPISYFLKAYLHGLLNDPSNAGLMYTECLNLSDAQQPAKNVTSHSGTVSGREDEQIALETFSILKAATLHNMAIEWANLHMPDQCRDALANAMEVGVNCLPQTHPVVLRILDTYKVMRQNFLFKGEPPSETKLTLTHPSPLPSFMGTDGVMLQKPLPPKSPKFVGEDQITDKRSPRVNRIQRSVAEAHPSQQRISPQDPPTQSAENPAIGLRESPRKRSAKRPMATPELPTDLIGRPLSPGAARTSYVVAMPEDGYAHALGSKYNPHKEHAVAEAQAFVARKKAASRIQSHVRRRINENALKKTTSAAATINRGFRGMRDRKKAIAERELVTARKRDIEAVMGDLLAMVEALAEVMADISKPEQTTDLVDDQESADDPYANDSTDSALPAEVADESATELLDEASDVCFSRDPGDEALAPGSPFSDEADAEVAHESSCDDSVPVQAEEFVTIIPASVEEEYNTFNPKTFVERYQIVRSDSNEALLGVILSSMVSENVQNVIQATIEDETSAQLETKLTMMSDHTRIFNDNASHLLPRKISASGSVSVCSDVGASTEEDFGAAAPVTEDELEKEEAELPVSVSVSVLVPVPAPVSESAAAAAAATAAEVDEVDEVDEKESSAEVPVEVSAEVSAALSTALEEVETSAAVAAAVVAAVAAVESESNAEAEAEPDAVVVTVAEAEPEASPVTAAPVVEAESSADAAVCADVESVVADLVSDVVSASRAESCSSDVVYVVSGAHLVDELDLENRWNSADDVWQPPAIAFERSRGPPSGANYVGYDGEGISPSNIEKLNLFSRATPSWEDRVSHWSPVESSWLASARKSEERSPSNAITGSSTTSTMKTLRSTVMGRRRSMSEDYLFELIAQCDGGLEDLEDGLSEVCASVFPDEELRETNLPGSQSQPTDWVSGSYGFGKSSRDDMNSTGSPVHGGDEQGSSNPPRKSDDQSTTGLASVLDGQALTADKETERSEELATNDDSCAKTEEDRELPALGLEIGWNPLNQDRFKVIRNVVSLYVYITLQYAVLEASSRFEEEEHS